MVITMKIFVVFGIEMDNLIFVRSLIGLGLSRFEFRDPGRDLKHMF